MYNPSKKDQKDFAQAITAAVGSTDKPKYGVSELQAEIKLCFPKKARKRKEVSLSDLDNLAKFGLDAVGKLFYEEDAQISRLVLEKCLSDSYGGKGFTAACFVNRVIDIED
jgi:Holliday junction resolvase RusA-like endonuclease